MAEDRITKLYREILEDLEKFRKRTKDFQEETSKLVQDLQEETSKLVQDLLKGAFDPDKIMQLLRRKGINMSQFGQIFGRMAQKGTMPQGFDPYRILGLEKSASDEEVKKRYRERVRQFHPDTAGPGMEFHFQCTLAAYELIKRERGWQ